MPYSGFKWCPAPLIDDLSQEKTLTTLCGLTWEFKVSPAGCPKIEDFVRWGVDDIADYILKPYVNEGYKRKGSPSLKILKNVYDASLKSATDDANLKAIKWSIIKHLREKRSGFEVLPLYSITKWVGLSIQDIEAVVFGCLEHEEVIEVMNILLWHRSKAAKKGVLLELSPEKIINLLLLKSGDIGWDPPLAKRFKINIDAAWKNETGAISGIVRDSFGDVVHCYGEVIIKKVACSRMAEAFAFRKGVAFCCEIGVVEIFIESDNLGLVKDLNNKKRPIHKDFVEIMDEIRGQLSNFKKVTIRYVPRVENLSADSIAAHVLQTGQNLEYSKDGLHFLSTQLPELVQHAIYIDKVEVPH